MRGPPPWGARLAVVALSRGFAVSAASRQAAPLHIVFGAAAIPHPDKAAKGGEDAFFCCDRTGSFGVADGVGGSARNGVDPGLFSREMLRRCHGSIFDANGGKDGNNNEQQQQEPLPRAVDAAATHGGSSLKLGGSSTLLVGRLTPNTNELRILNLGDSGALLLRPAVRRFSASKSQNVLWPRIALRAPAWPPLG